MKKQNTETQDMKKKMKRWKKNKKGTSNNYNAHKN